MKDFIDENALVIVCLTVVACWAMRVHIDAASAPIVNTIVGGMIGYLARGLREAIAK